SLVAFLTVPASVGLMVLGRPIVRLLFERGRFQALDTENTATALALYAVGLVAYAGVKVLAPAFYALGTPRVLRLAGASAVGAHAMAPMGGPGARSSEARVGTHGRLAQALGGLVPVAIGILVYAAASRLLRLPDAHALTIVLGAWVSGEERR